MTNDTKSDTPRTDSNIARKGEVLIHGDPRNLGGFYQELPDLVTVHFARKLERELNEAKSLLEQQQAVTGEDGLALVSIEQLKKIDAACTSLYEISESLIEENNFFLVREKNLFLSQEIRNQTKRLWDVINRKYEQVTKSKPNSHVPEEK